MAHPGKEAEGLSPAEQSSTASEDTPAPGAAAPGDEVGHGTALEHRETRVEQGSPAPGQLPADSQGSSKELLSPGQGVSPSELPPAKGAPQSKPETSTSPGAQSPQPGRELRQKGTSSTGKVSVSELCCVFHWAQLAFARAVSEAEEQQPRGAGLRWGGFYLSSVLLGVSSSPALTEGSLSYPQHWEVSLFQAAVLSGELWDPLGQGGFCVLSLCLLSWKLLWFLFPFTPHALGAGAH